MSSSGDLRSRVERAIYEIVKYMVLHGDAKDTLQGIHDWWLPLSGDECSFSELEEALRELVDWGWLAEHRLADQTVVYGASVAGLVNGTEYLKTKNRVQ